MKIRTRFLPILVVTLLLSACATPSSAKQLAPIEVTNAWVRTVGGMRSKSGSDTALFMTVRNNSGASDKLLKVESDAASMVQLHLSAMDGNGVSSMRNVTGLDIPAGGTAELKPGSYHVMLMGLTRDIKEGDTITFTLTFQNAGLLSIQAQVKTP